MSDAPGVRLLDRFAEAKIERTVSADPPARHEWRFDGAGTIPPPGDLAETSGWQTLNAIEELRVEGGLLRGRATAQGPAILYASRPAALAVDDPIHAIEIRMRVSEGTELSVSLNNTPDLLPFRFIGPRREDPPFRTPLIPGDEFHTYVLTNDSLTLPLAWQYHILVELPDAAGAEFAIESIRIVSLSEHLRSVSTGPGWHGLGWVRREALVSRSPERVSIEVDLPSRPWLDVAIGTIERHPVTFVLDVDAPDGTATAMRRTVTTADRWEYVPVDLGSFAGETVTLSLELEADEPGTLGFWGTLVVRSSGSVPIRSSAPTPARQALADGGTVRPQGVILILADTLRRDHLDAYGYHRSTAPELTRLASEGALFTESISQATWTKPSVPSILTSLYPSTHGVSTYRDLLPLNATTLAEAFQDAGYATFHAASNAWSSTPSNLHQGIDELHEPLSLTAGMERPSKTAKVVVDRFLDWLDTHDDVPFFGSLHVFDPHEPLVPHPPYDTMWADESAEAEHQALLAQLASIPDVALYSQGERLRMAGIDPEVFVSHEIDWYDGSIRGMDAEIGRLLGELQERGLADRTLVALISDHGCEFLEHGGREHGFTTYGEMLNVPLVLRWPGVIPAGIEVEEIVESIDLMPTLLELAGLSTPYEAQGQSLVPLLAGSDEPGNLGWIERGAFSERAVRNNPLHEARHVESISLVRGRWKLVQNLSPLRGRRQFELYDHVGDPLNLDDIARDHPDVVAELSGELALRREMAVAARLEPEAGGRQELSTEEIRRLRALGYLR